jgi:RNA polymerase sigma-70 factor (ECF subfamily)
MVGTRRRRRAPDRGEATVRKLQAEHGGAVAAYATKLTGDRAAAEDVLQETLIRVWRRASDLDERRGSIRAWMFTVAHRIIVDRARARAARPVEVAQHAAAEPSTDDHADGVADRVTVLRALETLPDEQRRVIVHLYYRGRTVTETAAVLGVPSGTVKSRSHYALRALRRRFAVPNAVLGPVHA